MSSIRIAIIGVNPVSASIGLALQDRAETIEIVGYDADRATADLARVRGALDQVRRKPEQACDGAGLVIVAEPLPEIQGTFASISPRLEDGAVVTDTARLKAPVLGWAEDLLPKHVSFVGGHVVPNPAVVGLRPLESLDDARPDLLKEALYCFSTSPSASGEAIDVCTWLAQAVEAKPFFIDVREHDGLLAGIEGLPELLSVALLRATVDTPGWEEMRKLAGHRFAKATEAVDDVHGRHPSLFLNRENVVRRLDVLIGELAHLRHLLVGSEEEALAQALADAADSRSRWMRERREGMWANEGGVDTRGVPSTGQQLRHMFLGNLASRPLRAGPRPRDEAGDD